MRYSDPIRWQCPTAVTTRVYTAKSDVYSFGVLLWEIYSGSATRFAGLAAGEVVRAVQAGERLHNPSACSPHEIMTLIRACSGRRHLVQAWQAYVRASMVHGL